jgi:hypothetical protein
MKAAFHPDSSRMQGVVSIKRRIKIQLMSLAYLEVRLKTGSISYG